MGPLPKIVTKSEEIFIWEGAPQAFLPPWCSVYQLEDPYTTREPLQTIVDFIKTWEGFPENDQKRRISKWAPEPKGLT